MSWYDQLQKGSIGGVEIEVDTSTDYVGRDKVLREYPFQDQPTVQDMGGVSKPGSFSAYVYGEDCFERRDALVRILNRRGPCDIVHPWIGLMRVEILGPVPMRHSTSEGGLVRFDIEFVRAETTRYPRATQNTARQTQAKIEKSRLSAIEDFAKKWSVDGLAGWAMNNSLQGMTRAVSAVNNTVSSLINKPSGYVAFETEVRLFTNELSGLIHTPATAALRLMDLMGSLSSIGSLSGIKGASGLSGNNKTSDSTKSARFNDGLTRQQTLFNWSADYTASPYTTPTRTQEAANHTALENLIQTGSLLAAAESICQTDFTTHWNYIEAMQWRATLNTAFQRLLGLADSAVYQDLLDTMAAVSDDLVTRSRHLGRITTITTPPIYMPALLVSYNHYGTIAYADEIVANNNIQHPLFVEPSSRLEVVSHDLTNRPQGKEPGTVMMWHRNGDYIEMQNDHAIAVQTESLIANVTTFYLNGDMVHNGDLMRDGSSTSTGDVIGNDRSLTHHDHDYYPGGGGLTQSGEANV